jgi:hypothetical protein
MNVPRETTLPIFFSVFFKWKRMSFLFAEIDKVAGEDETQETNVQGGYQLLQ